MENEWDLAFLVTKSFQAFFSRKLGSVTQLGFNLKETVDDIAEPAAAHDAAVKADSVIGDCLALTPAGARSYGISILVGNLDCVKGLGNSAYLLTLRSMVLQAPISMPCFNLSLLVVNRSSPMTFIPSSLVRTACPS
jgi:hypothetical protein